MTPEATDEHLEGLPGEPSVLNMQAGSPLPVHVWGIDQRGELVDVQAMRGRKVLLAFYLQDEAAAKTDLTDALERRLGDLREAGVEVVGVRGDALATRASADLIDELPFPMVQDRNYRFGQALDLLPDQRASEPPRALVLLDEEGRVVAAWNRATADDLEQAFRSVQ